MDRINKIYNSSMYRQELVCIVEDEKDRVYCKHDIEHFLDVARIAYIINLEKSLGYSKDIIYAIALLHDIGRHREYKEGVNHHKASAEIADFILKDAGYMPSEIKMINEAILHHRNKTNLSKLNELIYTADKISRKCYSCSAIATCKWSNSKKNKEIMY